MVVMAIPCTAKLVMAYAMYCEAGSDVRTLGNGLSLRTETLPVHDAYLPQFLSVRYNSAIFFKIKYQEDQWFCSLNFVSHACENRK